MAFHSVPVRERMQECPHQNSLKTLQFQWEGMLLSHTFQTGRSKAETTDVCKTITKLFYRNYYSTAWIHKYQIHETPKWGHEQAFRSQTGESCYNFKAADYIATKSDDQILVTKRSLWWSTVIQYTVHIPIMTLHAHNCQTVQLQCVKLVGNKRIAN